MKLTLSATVQRMRECGVVLFDPVGLLERLERLGDRRGERGRRYELAPVLLAIVFAKLAGEDTPSGIADWVADRASELRTALHVEWGRMPHPNTVRRILTYGVEPEELDRVVSEHLSSLPEVGTSRLIAFDGKTVRGTRSATNPHGDHLLAAYLPAEGIVLGQVAVGHKENEISEAPTLLGQLNLQNKIVMGDALHAQREISGQITAAGGDFIWLIKANQPLALEEITELFAPETPTVDGALLPNDFRRSEQPAKGHGRRERRQITVSSALKGYTAWPALEQVFRLERWRTNLQTGLSQTEVVYGLTSLSRPAASARTLSDLVRAYWGIENGLHHTRDVTFHEDRLRQTQGQAGHVTASLNNLVIGLLRHAGFTNLARARRVCNSLFNQATYLAIERMLT
jgi:predicted transposase YbfD/YdcC